MMLEDDRKKYNMGTEEPVDPMKETINNLIGLGVKEPEINIIKNNTMSSPEVRKIINRVEKESGAEIGAIANLFSLVAKKEERAEMKEGGPGIEALRQVAPEVVERMGYEEGGSIDDQMMMVMTPPMKSEMESEMPMESDDDMEDGYTRFIMEEALTEEEEDMLMSKLEQDEELAMIFDKVIDVAQEFAGAGPVEGPGSGVSDSIPARLSDGEFVFTAKAVEEIGADNLMATMKEAEAKADERQGLAMGGSPEENESKSLLSSGIVQTDEVAEDELKKRMVQGSSDYVRS